MATMAINHVSVAMGQVATTSIRRFSHYFFPTTFFLVIMTRCYSSLCKLTHRSDLRAEASREVVIDKCNRKKGCTLHVAGQIVRNVIRVSKFENLKRKMDRLFLGVVGHNKMIMCQENNTWINKSRD